MSFDNSDKSTGSKETTRKSKTVLRSMHVDELALLQLLNQHEEITKSTGSLPKLADESCPHRASILSAMSNSANGSASNFASDSNLLLTHEEEAYLESLCSAPGVPTHFVQAADEVVRRATVNFPKDAAQRLADISERWWEEAESADLEKLKQDREAHQLTDKEEKLVPPETTSGEPERKGDSLKSKSSRIPITEAYRKELWDIALEGVQQALDKKHAVAAEKYKETTKVEEEKTPSWSFKGIFSGITGGATKKPEEDDTTVDVWEEEGDIVYHYIGAPMDETCNHVLTPPMCDELRKHLPMAVQHDNFWLKYAMNRDGSAMRAIVQQVRNSTRTLLAIETMDGHVFGAFCSSPWIPRGAKYFGTGESFVFRLAASRFSPTGSVRDQETLERNVDVFKWSGHNRNVQRLERMDGQMFIGGGGPDPELVDPNAEEYDEALQGFALVLEPELETGYSNPCLTFKSPPLPPDLEGQSYETYEIANVEVWTLTPVDTMDQAEKVELGRRFIFEQSNFIED